MADTTPSARLRELGIELPPVPAPVAAYIPSKRAGALVYTSGQLPMRGGKLMAEGRVGVEVPLELAQDCARQAALNAVAAAAQAAGGVDRIASIVRVGVFVAAPDTFTDHPKVANGASLLLQEIFGAAGSHVRAAVGCPSLPLNAPVEVELLVEAADG
ncbi:MAG: RidA family protein [Candidatus Sumerlaeia bacterium]|nr:RidA family protein [Candidatus Sumerlaeia bacterium]